MNNTSVYISILFLMATCEYKSVNPAEQDCVSLPDSVYFQQDILPIINKECNTSGCHSGSKPAGNLNLDAGVAYHNLTNPKNGYIDLKNPSYSMVYSMMRGGGNVMPPTGQLSTCSTEAVLKWIEKGAKK